MLSVIVCELLPVVEWEKWGSGEKEEDMYKRRPYLKWRFPRDPYLEVRLWLAEVVLEVAVAAGEQKGLHCPSCSYLLPAE